MTRRLRPTRGVSLIEALLALVVMAMGMLAVAGVQTTLRGNADLSRQRAEALRLAQEGIEQARGFDALQGGTQNYADISSNGPSDISPAGANTTFSRTTAVTDSALSPGMKTVAVTVTWADRAGSQPPPMVQLFTAVAKVSPEVAASLSVPGEGRPGRQPQNRHAGIPPGAVSQQGDTSTYTPRQAGDGPSTTFTFNNGTGMITRLCTGQECETGTWLPLSGYVRSLLGNPATQDTATLANPTTPADAFFAADAAKALSLEVQNTADNTPITGSRCFIDLPGATENALEFLCAVPVLQNNAFAWSGKLRFKPGNQFAPNAVSNLPSLIRVCRYKPAPSASGNFENVSAPLALQNFLAIRAGDGAGTTYVCPAMTVAHQPG